MNAVFVYLFLITALPSFAQTNEMRASKLRDSLNIVFQSISVMNIIHGETVLQLKNPSTLDFTLDLSKHSRHILHQVLFGEFGGDEEGN